MDPCMYIRRLGGRYIEDDRAGARDAQLHAEFAGHFRGPADLRLSLAG